MVMDTLIKTAADSVLKRYSPFIDALILIGSYARGEEIVRRKEEGMPVFVSDLEFMVVVKPEAFPLTVDAKAIESELDRKIEITIGQTTVQHLNRLRPYIFTVELKRFGKVLWGNKGILERIPNYREKDIDPVDAFVLLNNRIVEQLQLRLKIDKGEALDKYLFDKGYVQIVNSFLGFNGRYQCLYPDKLREFSNLKDREALDLLPAVKQAFENIKNGKMEKVDKDNCLKRWVALNEAIRKIWLYEARKLLKQPQLELGQAIMMLPSIVPIADRIKGWLKLLKQSKASSLKGEILPNLLKTSPQFLIYQEAVLLYFDEKFDKEKAKKIVEKWEKIVK